MLRTVLRSAGLKNLRGTVIQSRTFRRMEQKTLDWAAGPLVWIDCEMTGLNPRKDKLLEIAVRGTRLYCLSMRPTGLFKVLITNGNLEVVDKGISYIIRTEKELLDGYVENCATSPSRSYLEYSMDDWCRSTHGAVRPQELCVRSHGNRPLPSERPHESMHQVPAL